MPTTMNEATEILGIVTKYLPPQDIKELFSELNEKVGKKTDNDSLKQSLVMLDQLGKMVDAAPKPAAPQWKWPLFAALGTVWLIHMALVVGMIASFFILPMYERWWVAIPCCVFIWYFTTSRIDCKITALENDIRLRLGLRPIRGFVGHYILLPIRRVRRRLQSRRQASQKSPAETPQQVPPTSPAASSDANQAV